MMAGDLFELSDGQIVTALQRCRRELRGSKGFPPRLSTPEILDRAGIMTGDEMDEAAALVAWEFVVATAKRHASQDSVSEVWGLKSARGRLETKCVCGHDLHDGERCRTAASVLPMKQCECEWSRPGVYASELIAIPEISERITTVIARIGGWGKVKTANESNLHFVKRDFFAAFKDYKGVKSVRKALPAGEKLPELSVGDMQKFLSTGKLAMPE